MTITQGEQVNPQIRDRAKQLFGQSLNEHHARTDRVFGWLMVAQFIAAVVWAFINAPLTYDGPRSSIHPHVLTALILGGLIAGPTALLTRFRPGHAITRIVVSVAQMLMGALLIHVSGGRIETHFHVFGSLAFLAFYRDWKLLIPATLVVLVDHIGRGILSPLSIYGVPSGAELRFVEHAAWVVFEDAVLIAACLFSIREMKEIALRQAELEEVNGRIEQTIVERTNELRRAEYRYGEVVHHAIDGIIFVGVDGLIEEINPSGEAAFGRAKAQIVGEPLSALFSAEVASAIDELRACEASAPSRLEWTALRDGCEEFPVEVSIATICSSEGKALTVFVRDLTEQKMLEAKLGHAQKMESIGHMSAGIAHEINTPNQYIGDNIRFVAESWPAVAEVIGQYRSLLNSHQETQGQMDAAERKADLEFVLEETPGALAQAMEGVQRVETIVRAMKEFAHPGGGGYENEVSINKVVENASLVSRNEWKYVADLTLDLAPELPFIRANQGEMGQVVLNLIVNAAHAIRDSGKENESGQIQLSTSVDENWVCIKVADNGCGIPEDVKRRIFEPFFTTKGVGIGTGQGLAIAHSVIVDRHKGEIEVDSDSSGTTFTIRVPVDLPIELAA